MSFLLKIRFCDLTEEKNTKNYYVRKFQVRNGIDMCHQFRFSTIFNFESDFIISVSF